MYVHSILKKERSMAFSLSGAGKNNHVVFIVVWVISTCAVLAPLLFSDMQQRVHAVSQTGIFGKVLRKSVVLKIFEGMSIGSSLPSLMNIFLDKVWNISNNSELGNHFFSLCVMSLTGIMYLVWNEEEFIPYLYACSFGMKLLTLCSVIMYSTSSGVIATQQNLHVLIFTVPFICLSALQIFISFILLFPENYVLAQVRMPLFLVSSILFYGCGFIWIYLFWRHYRINNCQLGFEERKELIHVLMLLFFAVAFQLVTSSDDPSNNVWVDTNERTLVIYCALYTFCSVVLTIFPIRLLRNISDTQESALRLKREFVRYVSHEIRSPLNVAHAGLEILKGELETTGTSNFVRELLDDIYFASNTAIDILNDMLQYEYIDSGTFKLDMAVTPMRKVFEGRLSAYKFMASKKSISLHIEDRVQVSEYSIADDLELGTRSEYENDPLYCNVLYIDKFRVEQILRNLMSNAIKFTPERGNITMIFSRTAAAADLSERSHPIHELQDEMLIKTIEGYLRIEVVDSGAGIAIENQSKLFNEFTQFNRNNLQGGGGSGLGLWICKNLVALHGGKINFHSDGEGKGTTFSVEFPFYKRRKDSSVALFHVDPVPPNAQNSLSGGTRVVSSSRVFPIESNMDEVIDIENGIQRLQILIVDDSSANRKMVRRMVENRANAAVLDDCSILEADDGCTALDVMRSEMAGGRRIHVVLMDFIMVHMNGPEAVQKMRAELGYDGIVIGITGNALPEDLTYFKDHGADMVITKPLTNAKLMDAICVTFAGRTSAEQGGI